MKELDWDPILRIHLELMMYPILSRKIRERMRKELFSRGIISPENFESEVREKAIESQRREGLTDPVAQESAELWQERLRVIRDYLTDFYFANNLPYKLFEQIVKEEIACRQAAPETVLSIQPELAPIELLFAKGEELEALPARERQKVSHHLEEIRVVLIKSIISDHLDFVGVAKRFFTVADLKKIYRRRIGEGKIGGKAAGMMLAWKILQVEDSHEEEPVAEIVDIPDSYFIGTDVFYEFMALNELVDFHNQKYKPLEQVEEEYPRVREAFLKGRFPEEVVFRLRELLERLGNTPLIVRSSSLLEDSFGTSFAGKYESHFCPNQGTLEENLKSLLEAIAKVYASVFGPNAISYRHRMGLVDYDERMAILIQRVKGTRRGRYFYPDLAGVGFSLNPYPWSMRIRREDGFLRLVWGLGTRAVERVGNDYSRMVALSHPALRPEKTAREIRRYSQRFIDVLDLEENAFKTLPVEEVLTSDYPVLYLIASEDKGDFIRPVTSAFGLDKKNLVITFDRLLRETPFPKLMRTILKKLERHYHYPVDVEFAITVEPGDELNNPRFIVHLLQCRPLSGHEWMRNIRIPEGIPEEDKLFCSRIMVPYGRVSDVRYVVYVVPEAYAKASPTERAIVARIIGRLNSLLEGEKFILMGPGRWGSVNPELGVKVSFANIYNASMLIEIARRGVQGTPELSFGTHFFQDLVEAQIYPLALYPEDEDCIFEEEFFLRSLNKLPELLPEFAPYAELVRVIDVPAASGGKFLEVVMDGEKGQALGFLKAP